MTTGLRINIPGPFARLVKADRPDLDWLILGGIYLPTGQARLYKVLADGSFTALAAFGTLGKDDSLVLKIMPNGTLRAIVDEALVNPDGTSASGSTILPTIYDFPGVFPAYQPPVASTVDSVARAGLAALDARLDKIAAGAAG